MILKEAKGKKRKQKKISVFLMLATLDNSVGIEDLTGHIPLLLQPLIQFSQQDFHAVENNFWTSPEIATVEKNIMKFAGDRRG